MQYRYFFRKFFARASCACKKDRHAFGAAGSFVFVGSSVSALKGSDSDGGADGGVNGSLALFCASNLSKKWNNPKGSAIKKLQNLKFS